MLVTKKVIIKLNNKNIHWFREKGYENLRLRKEIIVNTEDLMIGMNVYIDVICDYCLDNGKITYIQKSYKRYIEGRKEIEKDCCLNCIHEKGRELKSINNDNIDDKAFSRNGVPTSRQQRHICDILSGVLNYPCSWYALDIAFPKEKIFIEYNGGGHELSVLRGQYSEEEFLEKEKNRRNKIIDKGWKEIRIASRQDLLPNECVLNYILIYAKQIFSLTDNSWIEFDIDDSLVRTLSFSSYFAFGKLKKIDEIIGKNAS